MTPEHYTQRCSELGLNRGQLGEGFRGGMPFEIPQVINRDADEKVEKPPITEDLSRFAAEKKAPTITRKCVAKFIRQAKPHVRPVYQSLYGRGESVQTLAKKLKAHHGTIQQVIAGKPSVAMRKKLKPLLTKHEIKMLGWGI